MLYYYYQDDRSLDTPLMQLHELFDLDQSIHLDLDMVELDVIYSVQPTF